MTRSTFVLPEAQHDIKEASLWYESRETGLGLRLIHEVRSAIKLIAENPLRFSIIEEGVRRALLRSFPYSIYFVSDLNGVIIIAVLHQHRRPNIWRQRK